MSTYEIPNVNARNLDKPTPAEIAWLRVVLKENPGLTIRYQHFQTTDEIAVVAINAEQRVVARGDGMGRLDALKQLREHLKQRSSTSTAADPAAQYIRTGAKASTHTSNTRPPADQTAPGRKLTREQMMMLIRIAEAEQLTL